MSKKLLIILLAIQGSGCTFCRQHPAGCAADAALIAVSAIATHQLLIPADRKVGDNRQHISSCPVSNSTVLCH